MTVSCTSPRPPTLARQRRIASASKPWQSIILMPPQSALDRITPASATRRRQSTTSSTRLGTVIGSPVRPRFTSKHTRRMGITPPLHVSPRLTSRQPGRIRAMPRLRIPVHPTQHTHRSQDLRHTHKPMPDLRHTHKLIRVRAGIPSIADAEVDEPCLPSCCPSRQ